MFGVCVCVITAGQCKRVDTNNEEYCSVVSGSSPAAKDANRQRDKSNDEDSDRSRPNHARVIVARNAKVMHRAVVHQEKDSDHYQSKPSQL